MLKLKAGFDLPGNAQITVHAECIEIRTSVSISNALYDALETAHVPMPNRVCIYRNGKNHSYLSCLRVHYYSNMVDLPDIKTCAEQQIKLLFNLKSYYNEIFNIK